MDTLPITLQSLITDFIKFIPSIIASIVIFVIGFFLAGFVVRMARKGMERRKMDPELILLISQILRWTVIGLFTVTALQQVNFDLAAFLTGLGIVGFTVGFALQDVSKNFIAGLLLLIQQPFDLGESIEVKGIGGTVLKIDLRATELNTWDGKIVLIPNADVFTNTITNFSRPQRRRINLDIGVAYGSDLERVREVTLNVVKGITGVLEDPAPTVVFNRFGASSLDFTLYFWIETKEIGLFPATDAAVVGIKQAFEMNGIEIPFPTRMVFSQTSGGNS